MIQHNNLVVRHAAEGRILEQALGGDKDSVKQVLQYLSSKNPSLRQIMKLTIHDFADLQIWSKLFHCLVNREWNGLGELDLFQHQPAADRIDHSIVDLFITDKRPYEGNIKEVFLKESLHVSNAQVRYTAGYLLGLRGDIDAVPSLTEAIEDGEEKWKNRAVEALAELEHESVGPPLIKALAMGNKKLHLKSSRVLKNLNKIVGKAWERALDHPDSHVRWHAARGLGSLGDKRYYDAIAEGLADENPAVRWASADVLAKFGRAGVPATLRAISRLEFNEQTRRAASHALKGITSKRVQKEIKPLLDALNSLITTINAPTIAQQLLFDWENESE